MSDQGQWRNFIVSGKKARLSDGHIDARDLSAGFEAMIEEESYYSLFDLEERSSFKAYLGKMRPALGAVVLDFDHKESNGEQARKDVLDFIRWAELTDDQYLVFFSGNKGFHLYVPETLFGLPHDEKYSYRLRDFLKATNKLFNSLDVGIYNPARKIRVPFSKHAESGLYKIFISKENLEMSADAIREMAKERPMFFDLADIIKNNHGVNKKITSMLIEEIETKSDKAPTKESKTRHDKLVKFVLTDKKAANIEQLVLMTLQHDVAVNSSDKKGPYFYDEKYLKGKSQEAACREFVERLINYKKDKHSAIGIEWTVGSTALDFVCTEKGRPLPIMINVCTYLEAAKKYKDKIWYDTFCGSIQFNDGHTIREWTDEDDGNIVYDLQSEWDMLGIKDNVVRAAVSQVAFYNKKNGPKEEIEKLKWDGQSRIERLFIDFFGAEDTQYSRDVSKNFMISLVARIYDPGCKVDTMPILEGPQGVYKSTGLEALGGKYYIEAQGDIGSKDFLANMHGVLIFEIAELHQFSKADQRRIKQMITCRVDKFRMPYDRRPRLHKRTCVWVGTTNEGEYLSDDTGARRFWPIKVTKSDTTAIKLARGQLFAEALALYKSGAQWWTAPAGIEEQHEARQIVDEFVARIETHLVGRSQVTVSSVATDAFGIAVADLTPALQSRIGRALKKCGWKCYVVKQRAASVRVWRSPSHDHKIEKDPNSYDDRASKNLYHIN